MTRDGFQRVAVKVAFSTDDTRVQGKAETFDGRVFVIVEAQVGKPDDGPLPAQRRSEILVAVTNLVHACLGGERV